MAVNLPIAQQLGTGYKRSIDPLLMAKLTRGYTLKTYPTYTRVSAVFSPKPMEGGRGAREYPGVSLYFTPKPTGWEGGNSQNMTTSKSCNDHNKDIITRENTRYFPLGEQAWNKVGCPLRRCTMDA